MEDGLYLAVLICVLVLLRLLLFGGIDALCLHAAYKGR